MGISAADIDWQAITEDHSRIANVANESFEVEMNIGSWWYRSATSIARHSGLTAISFARMLPNYGTARGYRRSSGWCARWSLHSRGCRQDLRDLLSRFDFPTRAGHARNRAGEHWSRRWLASPVVYV